MRFGEGREGDRDSRIPRFAQLTGLNSGFWIESTSTAAQPIFPLCCVRRTSRPCPRQHGRVGTNACWPLRF